jgi:hypothetical protein
MTSDQIQTQIQHTERLARAKVATLVAESKIRRAQTIQSFEFERGALVQREEILRQENRKAVDAESKERIKATKNESHQKLKQMRRTGDVEREYMLQQYDCEMKARLQFMERESQLRMQQMAKEHALKMQLLNEESQTRLQIMRGDFTRESRAERPASSGSTQSKTLGFPQLAQRHGEINHIKGRVNMSLVGVDGEAGERYKSVKEDGDALDNSNVAMRLPTKLRVSEDTTAEFRSMYVEPGRQATSSISDIDERIRRLKASNDVALKRRPKIRSTAAEDATIELTDVSPLAERTIGQFSEEHLPIHRTLVERATTRKERPQTSYDIMAEAREQLQQIRAATALKRA